MKTITINGRIFELLESKDTVYPARARFDSSDAIYKVYERPSQIKVSIWHDWRNWGLCHEILGLEISSYNCMQFTITGLAEIDGEYYNLRITKCHNRAYKVNSFKY